MKLAGADVIVWLIIFAIVAIAKAWGKLATPTDEANEPAPPPRPRPRPARPPPIGRAVAGPVPPKVEPPKRVPTEVPATPPAPAPAPVPTATHSRRFDRSARWAAALRDKQNVRNIIISAEIIGRPKGAAN
jgi:hypothetical protein